MFFNIVADSVEDNADLAAQAVGVAHRTQNGVLNATGINGGSSKHPQDKGVNLKAVAKVIFEPRN